MAILVELNISILFLGDGTSTVFVVDLDDAPIVFTSSSTIQPHFNFKESHPSAVIPVSLNGSNTNKPSASVAGTTVTFTFPAAPDSVQNNLTCAVVF